MKDLAVLAACKDGEMALKGIFSRPQALGTRAFTVDTFRHPQRDPGCLNTPELVLGPLASKYRHALVLMDREGSGLEPPATADDAAALVERRFAATDWAGRARAIVLEPELEQWVWSDSREVDAVLGWSGRSPSLREWLEAEGMWERGRPKPARPKEAMQAALRAAPMARSSSLYEQLGKRVSLQRCEDPAFKLLVATLREWFPAEE